MGSSNLADWIRFNFFVETGLYLDTERKLWIINYYIPGDVSHYDNRGLIAQIKYHLAQLCQLESKLQALRGNTLASRPVVVFKTKTNQNNFDFETTLIHTLLRSIVNWVSLLLLHYIQLCSNSWQFYTSKFNLKWRTVTLCTTIRTTKIVILQFKVFLTPLDAMISCNQAAKYVIAIWPHNDSVFHFLPNVLLHWLMSKS